MRSHVGWGKLPCPECGKYAQGIRPGDRCPDCNWARQEKGSLVGRKAALLGVVAYGAWVMVARPASPVWLVAAGAPITYVMVRFFVSRIVQEFLP